MTNKNITNHFFLLATIGFYIWSFINPQDYFVWFLETLPIVIGFVLIFLTRKSFPLSNFLYRLILIHMIILTIGGHYTYAEVPLFNDIRDFFGSSRNDYDKVGHFFQGMTAALLMYEIILRRTKSIGNSLIFILSVSAAVAFSAMYEVFEMVIALATGEGVDFVSMQGDVWDAQKDMLTAFFGAVFILLFFRAIHGKSVNKLFPNKRQK